MPKVRGNKAAEMNALEFILWILEALDSAISRDVFLLESAPDDLKDGLKRAFTKSRPKALPPSDGDGNPPVAFCVSHVSIKEQLGSVERFCSIMRKKGFNTTLVRNCKFTIFTMMPTQFKQFTESVKSATDLDQVPSAGTARAAGAADAAETRTQSPPVYTRTRKQMVLMPPVIPEGEPEEVPGGRLRIWQDGTIEYYPGTEIEFGYVKVIVESEGHVGTKAILLVVPKLFYKEGEQQYRVRIAGINPYDICPRS